MFFWHSRLPFPKQHPHSLYTAGPATRIGPANGRDGGNGAAYRQNSARCPLMAKRSKGELPGPNITPYAMQQIAAVIDSVRARLLEADPDIERDAALYIDCMDGESDAVDYMRKLGRAYLDCKAFEEAIAERIAALRTRQERVTRRKEAYKAALYTLMNIAGVANMPDTDFSAYTSAGRERVNEDIDQHIDELPARYIVIEKRVNKALLLEDLKADVKVEHARLTNGSDVFTIKGK